MSTREKRRLPAAPVPIVFRRMRFGLGQMSKYWYAGSPAATHYFNALSAAFPDGERYFVAAVRAFEHRVDDPVLREQVRAFVRQEGHHTHHHRALNEVAEQSGADMARCAQIAQGVLDRSRRRDTPLLQLAKTAAFEHFTALMGDWLLRHPERFEAEPEVAELWFWHAAEETEHKAVAYDVYHCAGGGYWMRLWAMLWVTATFLPRIHQMQCLLLWRDETRFSLRDMGRCLRLLYGRGGFIRSLLAPYLQYYRRDFHPWQDDNSHLVTAWQAQRGHSPQQAA